MMAQVSLVPSCLACACTAVTSTPSALDMADQDCEVCLYTCKQAFAMVDTKANFSKSDRKARFVFPISARQSGCDVAWDWEAAHS